VLVIATDKDSAQEWARVKGVTHVSDQAGAATKYKHPTVPPVPFQPLHDRSAEQLGDR
jgi:hypothetical protein